MKRSVIVLCTAVFVVCVAAWMVAWSKRHAVASQIAEYESYEHRDGRKEAEVDIAQGQVKWKVCGLYSSESEDATRLKRLGVQVDWFAGCIVSDAIYRYRYAYNSTVYSHFVRLVGKEITEEVLATQPIPPADEPKG